MAPSGTQPSHEPRPLETDENLQTRGHGPAGSNPPAETEGSRQGYGSRPAPLGVREAAALLLLGLAVLLLYLANAAVPRQTPAAVDAPAQNLELRFQAQFELGVRRLLPAAEFDSAVDQALAGRSSSSQRLEVLAHTPRERIALAPVLVYLHPGADGSADGIYDAREAALTRLSSIEADESLDVQVRDEAGLFAGWLREPELEPAEGAREQLLSTYGYFARLALDPDSALAEARQTALVFYLLAVAALVALVCGAGVLAFLLHRMSRGKLQLLYRRRQLAEPASAGRLPYLETALVFLVAVTVVGGLVGLAMGDSGSHWLLLLNWTVVAVLFWPLARGRGWPDLRRALGWHRGRGVLREIGCGLVAYLASMPMLAIGLAMTLIFTRFAEQPPHHPIVDWLQEAGSGGIAVVVILAVVWAPLVEESLFRGGLYHYFRGRLGIFGSVLVVSLVFAAIHPQGLAGIPFLTTLAVALGLTREWRDSIVASVTLHTVHNGLTTLLLLALIP